MIGCEVSARPNVSAAPCKRVSAAGTGPGPESAIFRSPPQEIGQRATGPCYAAPKDNIAESDAALPIECRELRGFGL